MLGCYFYKDYEDYKLRIICLNTSDGAYIGISNSQYKWFIQSLDLSSKSNASDWQILIMSHVPLDWSAFTAPAYILQAYLNGTSWTNGTISCNFANKNKAKIIATIHGHIHNFLVDKLHVGGATSSTQIDVYRIAMPEVTESYHNHYEVPFHCDTSYPKVSGTEEDTSFSMVCIDLDNYVIKCICYGAGVDRELTYYKETAVNLVPTSLDLTSDGVYNNGLGYRNGYYVSTSGGGDSVDGNCVVTGLIPYMIPEVGLPKTIYIKGATIETSNSHVRFSIYQASKLHIQAGYINAYHTVETLGDNYYKLTPLTADGNSNSSKMYVDGGWHGINYYIRFSLIGTGENLFISTEPID
jgi:hypothetical protein